MQWSFTKMHGIGNDFIVLSTEVMPENASAIAQLWCDRRYGIGADGVVWVLPSLQSEAVALMRIWNADGTESGQCGNAIRCVARFLWENGTVQSAQFGIETRGRGVQRVQLQFGPTHQLEAVRVDMGCPAWDPKDIPHHCIGTDVIAEQITIDGRTWTYDAVSMGNPHCVIRVDQVQAVDVARDGRTIGEHPVFPERANVSFVEVVSSTHLRMRVWERGVGETLACGSGACAAMITQFRAGRVEASVTVTLPGGTLQIEWDETNGRVAMVGEAQTVYTGRWNG